MKVLYHANCKDGFGAAWAAWKTWRGSAEYIPVQYGETPLRLGKDDDVMILDFSFPRDVIERIKDGVKSLVVIDHHVNTGLEGLNYCYIDTGHSGAVLTWRHLYGTEPPELLRYIEDRDLWKWEMEESREVSAGLDLEPMEFEHWDTLDIETLKANGRAVLRYQRELVRRICNNATLCQFHGWEVPMVSSNVLQSEVGEELLERYDKVPFVVIEGQKAYSLRSRKGQFDVAAFAKAYGGGGHQAAAGIPK